MFILDTNIISELMKPSPDKSLVAWLDRQVTQNLFITSISVAEIHYGLGILAAGQRRSKLEKAFNAVIDTAFNHRVLKFDKDTAKLYGVIMSGRKRLGKPMSAMDGQIAAITQSYTYALVTRNTRDFLECDITLLNPFNNP